MIGEKKEKVKENVIKYFQSADNFTENRLAQEMTLLKENEKRNFKIR